VIRTTTLLLVLVIAGTPAATTLCIGKCDAEAAPGGTAAPCHHRSTSDGKPGILDATHGCDDRLQAEPFVREDVQRIASGSATDHAVVVAAFPMAAWTPSAVGAVFPPRAPAPRGSEAPVVLRI